MGKILGFLKKYIRYIAQSIIVLMAAYFVLLSFIAPGPDETNEFLLFPYLTEAKFFDMRYMNWLEDNPYPKSEHVVLAKIDDPSLAQIGRFPWSRNIWIKLMKKFEAFEAKVIAYDVVFPEPEEACYGDPDSLFAETISSYNSGAQNVIIGYSRTRNPEVASEEFPDILYNYFLETTQDGDVWLYPNYVDRYSFPIEKLTNADLGLGYIDTENDQDGVFRNYRVYANILDPADVDPNSNKIELQVFASFGLLAYERYMDDRIKIHFAKNAEGFLKTKNHELEIDPYGAMKLRYRGGREAFHDVSIKDILAAPDDDQDMKNLLKGKAVFIGSTAFAAHDFRNTPMDPKLPGVYFHMSLTDMLVEGRLFRPKGDSAYYTWLFLIIGALLILAFQSFENPILDLIGAVTVGCLAWFADYYYFIPNGYELKLFFTINCFALLYFWDTAWSFYINSQEKKKIKGTFSRYVAPTIVNEMLDNPEKLKMGGERKDITVFFSDVRDFTSISEKLTPTQLSDCLNQYMNRMTNIMFETKGTLDKYIGDAIVGYWGAPVEIENHPYLGVSAAVEMIELLPEINKDFEEQGYPEFKVGIGLNTGVCSVGNMGSDQIFSYTALGDHMNLGARLEGLCKPYGAQIIISEYTHDRLTDEQKRDFTFRELDLVRVKGKEKPVKIYEVLHCFHDFKKDAYACELYHSAYHAYLNQEFAKAVEILEEVLGKYPDDVASNRIKTASNEFIANPPGEDWDGVTTMKTK